ncbi:MAG: hypothetical protein ACI865_000137 [Flavobacteriaceae bacterium]|jgi:hypothetical protein
MKSTIGLWMIFFALSLPFNFSTLPHPGIWITEAIYPISHWIGQSLFDFELVAKATTSDAATLYIQMGLLFIIAVIISQSLKLQHKIPRDQLLVSLHKTSVYVLAFFLLKYGFDKLFHIQFYPPEPNTLFTPVGALTKDILFWSTMGSSGSYNTFMGVIEILPGLLLLWKRTRLIGALIALGVLVNVFALNIGFDITVKLLSLYLVLLALYVLSPWYKMLLNVFVQNGNGTGTTYNSEITIRPMAKRVIKGAIVFIFALELLTPYIDRGSFSGHDYSKTPHFGSYEITNPEVGFLGDSTLRRIHIHSKGYLITESNDGEFTDHRIRTSSLGNKIIFLDIAFVLSVEQRKNFIAFSWAKNGTNESLNVRKIDLDALPLKDDSAHWTVDGLMNSSKK